MLKKFHLASLSTRVFGETIIIIDGRCCQHVKRLWIALVRPPGSCRGINVCQADWVAVCVSRLEGEKIRDNLLKTRYKEKAQEKKREEKSKKWKEKFQLLLCSCWFAGLDVTTTASQQQTRPCGKLQTRNVECYPPVSNEFFSLPTKNNSIIINQ